MNRIKKNYILIPIFTAILSLIFMIIIASSTTTSINKSYSSFTEDLNSHNISTVIMDTSPTMTVILNNGEKYSTDNPQTNNLKETLLLNNIKVKDETVAPLIKTLPSGIFVVSLLTIMFMLIAKARGGSGSMTSMDIEDFSKNKKVALDFDSVAGNDEAKESLMDIVDFLKSPEKYQKYGARMPKGVILYGSPGTGKTLLAKAVAGEAGVPFFIISGSDFVEMFVGVGASRVRDLFAEAKKNAPCIIFIDEIDAVGRQRGAGLGGGHDEREQTLNQLLVEMDGFAANEGVIVLAATNRPDVLDKALLRAGRFDRQIVVGTPDVKARQEILEVHARKKRLADDVDLSIVAKNTAGFAGADLENVLNEAALLAARRDKLEIGMLEIEDAMVKVTMGPEKRTKVISEKEKKLVAYHEAGHAVASFYLETQDDVHQISIIPRGMAGGYTMYRPTEDKSFMSKSEMEENLISLLGGRVAEAIVLGDVSTGASNDIERASKISRSMVTKYGMSEKLGTITFGSGQEEVFLGRDFTTQKNFSEETSALIDSEVKRIIDTAYAKTEEILRTNIDKLHAVAGVLLEKEKIDGDEFKNIMNS